MRVNVVEGLISILRDRRYPGYEEVCVNSRARVSARAQDLYGNSCGATETFMPKQVLDATESARTPREKGASLISDKIATTAEPAGNIDEIWARFRPIETLEQRSTNASSSARNEYGYALSRYQNVGVHIGSTVLNQSVPWHIGMSLRFTLPVAVGGFDFPGKDWRRLVWEKIVHRDRML